jgi:hypothetical protein
MNTLAANALDAALALATQQYLPCFPVSTSKAPTCPHGFKDATADPDGLRELWRRYPGPLVGMPTGSGSGIDVFDIDSAKHPEAAAWWTANRYRMPPTRTHRTRSGGRHLLFHREPGLRNSTGEPGRGLGVRGLDVRADGGYIIRWEAAGFEVVRAGPLAPWPQWLLEGVLWKPAPVQRAANTVTKLRDLDAYAVGALRSAVKRVAGAPEGCRNSTLNREAYSLARLVKDGQLNECWVTDVLAAAAVMGGQSSKDAYATIASGLRSGYSR